MGPCRLLKTIFAQFLGKYRVVSALFGKIERLTFTGTFDAFQHLVKSHSFKQICFPHRSEMGVLKSFHKFSGMRYPRGLYRTATGERINSDIQGALNILRKACGDGFLQDLLKNPAFVRGCLNHPASAYPGPKVKRKTGKRKTAHYRRAIARRNRNRTLPVKQVSAEESKNDEASYRTLLNPLTSGS